MENFDRVDLSSVRDKLNTIGAQMENLESYVDQRFDELAGVIDELESRINNLR
ncbi:MAG: hypothetical protein LBB18_00315 [Puniceicoccales bacterium]|jgi:hypothetical protein|nr:hypothetical protein [Puniceicoccales bacterium]